jgi:hypothetical protein
LNLTTKQRRKKRRLELIVMPKYRVYADGDVVHEDEFEERDNSQPYYDDYSEHTVPEGDEDAEYWDVPAALF